MKILIVNKFLHHVGGVETYIDWLSRNLENAGHELHFFGMSPPPGSQVLDSIAGRATFTPNRDFSGHGAHAAISAASSVYSRTVARKLEKVVGEFNPEMVHFHMTCRQLTPSVGHVVRVNRIPSVTTAHEYKFVCASQRLWNDHDQTRCTACLHQTTLKRASNILVKQCVRGSIVPSAIAAVELPISDKVWRRSGTVIHAPSQFMASTLRASPWIAGPIEYLDLSWGSEVARNAADGWENTVAYTGRLSREKGVDTLLKAWKLVQVGIPNARLRIAGSGNAAGELRMLASELALRNVEFLGRYEPSELKQILDGAAVTVHPSRWDENSPYTVRESLQHGVPAIVSNRGGLPEMVSPDTGTVFAAEDVEGLAGAIQSELAVHRAGTREFRQAVARRIVTDGDHLDGLHRIYDLALLQRP